MLRCLRFTFPLRAGYFKCDQPFRSKIYHYALQPKMLTPNETVEPNEERLYKPVAPADKWEHTSSNYDPLVSRITGMITERGERETAREAMRLTFREIKLLQLEKFKGATEEEKKSIVLNPIQVVHDAVKNCTPLLILHSVVRGGMLYKVPAPPSSDSQAEHIAIKFLIDAARDKPAETRIWTALARELVAASQNQGKAFRRKQEMLKQCEENRAYATYRTY